MVGTDKGNYIYIKKVYEDGNSDNAPLWGIQKKVGGEYKIISTHGFVSGSILGIEKGSYEYTKGRKKIAQNLFKIKIGDGKDVYLVSLNYAYSSRMLLNSLSGIADFKGKSVKISIYKNKDGFDSFWVEVDGERTEWLINVKEKPLPGSDDEKWDASFDYFIEHINAAPKDSEGDFQEVAQVTEEAILDPDVPENFIGGVPSADEMPEIPEELKEENSVIEDDDLPF